VGIVGISGGTPGAKLGGDIMTIARTNGVLVGTSESVGITVGAGVNVPGVQVDLLTDVVSTGQIVPYVLFTTGPVPPKGGLLTVVVNDIHIAAGNKYAVQTFTVKLADLTATTTYKRRFNRFPVNRYASADVTNGGDQALNNVVVSYELEKTT
jgi:hypothetical protein